MTERQQFTLAEELILKEVRSINEKTERLQVDTTNIRFDHIENKNSITSLNEKFNNHLEEHKESLKDKKDFIYKPLFQWIFGGGLFAVLILLVEKLRKV